MICPRSRRYHIEPEPRPMMLSFVSQTVLLRSIIISATSLFFESEGVFFSSLTVVHADYNTSCEVFHRSCFADIVVDDDSCRWTA